MPNIETILLAHLNKLLRPIGGGGNSGNITPPDSNDANESSPTFTRAFGKIKLLSATKLNFTDRIVNDLFLTEDKLFISTDKKTLNNGFITLSNPSLGHPIFYGAQITDVVNLQDMSISPFDDPATEPIHLSLMINDQYYWYAHGRSQDLSSSGYGKAPYDLQVTKVRRSDNHKIFSSTKLRNEMPTSTGVDEIKKLKNDHRFHVNPKDGRIFIGRNRHLFGISGNGQLVSELGGYGTEHVVPQIIRSDGQRLTIYPYTAGAVGWLQLLANNTSAASDGYIKDEYTVYIGEIPKKQLTIFTKTPIGSDRRGGIVGLKSARFPSGNGNRDYSSEVTQFTRKALDDGSTVPLLQTGEFRTALPNHANEKSWRRLSCVQASRNSEIEPVGNQIIGIIDVSEEIGASTLWRDPSIGNIYHRIRTMEPYVIFDNGVFEPLIREEDAVKISAMKEHFYIDQLSGSGEQIRDTYRRYGQTIYKNDGTVYFLDQASDMLFKFKIELS